MEFQFHFSVARTKVLFVDKLICKLRFHGNAMCKSVYL